MAYFFLFVFIMNVFCLIKEVYVLFKLLDWRGYQLLSQMVFTAEFMTVTFRCGAWFVLLPAWSCSPYHVFQVPTSSQGYSGSVWMDGKMSSLKAQTQNSLKQHPYKASEWSHLENRDFLLKFIVSIKALRFDIVNCKETTKHEWM